MVSHAVRTACSLLRTANASVAVVSKSAIRENMAAWNALMPRTPAYYAVKSCPLSSVLDEMVACGGRFDVSSIGEVLRVSNALKTTSSGDGDSRMIYTNPCRTREEIEFAIHHGIRTFTVDDPAEMRKLEQVASVSGTVVDILLRIPGDERNSKIKLNTKFGHRGDLQQICDEFTRTSHLCLKGISYHVGSYCQNWQSWQHSVDDAHKTVCDIAASFIINRSPSPFSEDMVIDIGGGFRNFNDVQNVVNYVKFPPNYRYWAEPGRLLSNNVITLFTRVKSVRNRPDGYYVTLNDSIYGSFSCLKHDTYVPDSPRVIDQDGIEIKRGSTSRVFYVGQTCDGTDMITSVVTDRVPTEDSIVAWPNIGSYSIASASEFNGFPKPLVIN